MYVFSFQLCRMADRDIQAQLDEISRHLRLLAMPLVPLGAMSDGWRAFGITTASH
jgi:hypothetical protein